MSYPHDHENEVIYFARTNFRNQLRKFGVKTDDRRRHMYVIGKTGMGKTVLLENMFLSDIYAGHGCCYVDPHGDTAERLIDYIPSWRINDVIYFNPADLDNPIGFNILETVSDKSKHLVASGMMGVFKKIWENLWSARMEYILNNSILALLDNPGSTLLGINRMLSDADFRRKIVSNVQDPIVKQFWLVEFASYQEKYAQEAVAPIQNKIGQFLSASVIRNIVAQVKSTINIRNLMDEEKIFIINLSKGRIGEDNMRLLGGLLITKIQLAAMERVDMGETERKDFYLYVDEFQNFAVESFASILSEARKYRLCLTIAHQYISQLSDEVREAVFGNVGTTITFRVGAPDATYMEKEFFPRFLPEDIINLPKYNIYLKLLIDGVTSQPFSASTLPPIAKRTGSEQKVIKVSRERYTTPAADIAEKVMKWTGMGDDATIAVKVAEVEEKKKSEKASKKPRFEYKCSRCGKDIVLPVQLDTTRPIYCEECIELVRAERERGKGRMAERKSPPPPPRLNEGTPVLRSAPAPAPKPASLPRPAAPAPQAPVVAHAPSAVAHAAPTAAEPSPVSANDFLSQVLASPRTISNEQAEPAAPARPQPTTPSGAVGTGDSEERKRSRRRRKGGGGGGDRNGSQPRPPMSSAPRPQAAPRPPLPPSTDSGWAPLSAIAPKPPAPAPSSPPPPPPHVSAPQSGTVHSGDTIKFD